MVDRYSSKKKKTMSISAPPRLTLFPRDDSLPCHPDKNVIFI